MPQTAQSMPRSAAPLRLHREAEVPRVLRAITTEYGISATSAARGDAQRPDPLAGVRQERRQIIAIAQMVCQATVEALAGMRPVQQLSRWLEAEVHRKVRIRTGIMARQRTAELVQHTPLNFRHIRTSRITATVWEVSVVFSDQQRTRACALRLQAHRGKWRVTAMELG